MHNTPVSALFLNPGRTINLLPICIFLGITSLYLRWPGLLTLFAVYISVHALVTVQALPIRGPNKLTEWDDGDLERYRSFAVKEDEAVAVFDLQMSARSSTFNPSTAVHKALSLAGSKGMSSSHTRCVASSSGSAASSSSASSLSSSSSSSSSSSPPSSSTGSSSSSSSGSASNSGSPDSGSSSGSDSDASSSE